jgi:hypothetical protein
LEVRGNISARSRPVHSPSWVVSPDGWVPGILVSIVAVLENTRIVVVAREAHSPTVPGVLPPLTSPGRCEVVVIVDGVVEGRISARSRPVHSPSWIVSPDGWVPGVLVTVVAVLENTGFVVVSREVHSPSVPGVHPPFKVRGNISARSRPVHSPSWVVSPHRWVPGVLVSGVTVLENSRFVVVSRETHSPRVPGILPPLEVRRDISARARPVHSPSWVVSPDRWVPGVLVSVVTVLENSVRVVVSSEVQSPTVPGILPPLSSPGRCEVIVVVDGVVEGRIST